MYLDGFDNFFFKFLVQKYFLYPCLKNGSKITLLVITQKYNFSPEIWRFKQIAFEISFLEMYTFIYFTLSVFKLEQKQFSQKATILPEKHHP